MKIGILSAMTKEHDQLVGLTIQTAVYFFLAMAAVYVENWVIHHKEQKDVARMLQFL